MFIIAGMQPKTTTLSDIPWRCARCGLQQAYAQRVDHYLSLFFIPKTNARFSCRLIR